MPLEGYHTEASEDASGEVVAVGDDVTDFKVGDRVTPIIFQGHHQARDLSRGMMVFADDWRAG